MISKKLAQEINNQINAEMFSGYLYLSMQTYFEDRHLTGMAHWMHKQAGEEFEHAMKFWDYLFDQGEKVVLKAIDAPQTEFSSVISIFEATLEHEKKITALIDKLYDMAVKDKDYASQAFLDWFVKEQVEEEKNAMDILADLAILGEKGNGLYLYDKQLGQR